MRAAFRVASAALGLTACAVAPAQDCDFAFERELYKSRFEHEVQFRAAAIHVAWGAEPLCDQTTQIEPFVLPSLQALRHRMSDDARRVFTAVTGMDEQWRVVWVDEAAPEALKVEAVLMSEFRRSTTLEHVRRIQAIQKAQLAQEREVERREALAQEEAQRQPLNLTPTVR